MKFQGIFQQRIPPSMQKHQSINVRVLLFDQLESLNSLILHLRPPSFSLVWNRTSSTANNLNQRQTRHQPLDDDETTNEYLLPKTIDEIRQLIQIMSRTDSENVRKIELDLIRTGSQKQVELPRLFLEYNRWHVLGS